MLLKLRRIGLHPITGLDDLTPEIGSFGFTQFEMLLFKNPPAKIN